MADLMKLVDAEKMFQEMSMEDLAECRPDLVDGLEAKADNHDKIVELQEAIQELRVAIDVLQ